MILQRHIALIIVGAVNTLLPKNLPLRNSALTHSLKLLLTSPLFPSLWSFALAGRNTLVLLSQRCLGFWIP